MTCDSPVRECLAWHIKPKLAAAKIAKDGAGIRARCPACGGSRELSISAGEQRRIVWNCYAGCPGPAIRLALIRAGVPAGCLPNGRAATGDIAAAVTAALREGGQGHARKVLRAYLLGLGFTRWPRGSVLRALAQDVGVSRAEAFRARAGAPLSPGACPVPCPPGEDVSSGSRSAQVTELVRTSELVSARDQVSRRDSKSLTQRLPRAAS